MQAAKRKIPHVNYRTVNDPAMPCTKHDGQVVDRRVRRRRRGRKGFIPVSIARGIHSLPHSSGFCHHPRLSAAALGTLSKAMSTEMAPGGKQNEKKNLRYLFGMGGGEGWKGWKGRRAQLCYLEGLKHYCGWQVVERQPSTVVQKTGPASASANHAPERGQEKFPARGKHVVAVSLPESRYSNYCTVYIWRDSPWWACGLKTRMHDATWWMHVEWNVIDPLIYGER